MSKMTGDALVRFARSKIGTPYVYGMKGEVLTRAKYFELKKMYGDYVWNSDIKKVGQICVDCSGLISWACGVTLGSFQWFQRASAVRPIKHIAKAPIGALVWCKGHIGIYTGMKNRVPYYIAADGSAYGVREVPLSYNHFTHYLIVDSVFEYADIKGSNKEDDEVVTKEKIKYNDVEYEVKLIRKDGFTFINSRDLAKVFDKKITNDRKMPVFTDK